MLANRMMLRAALRRRFAAGSSRSITCKATGEEGTDSFALTFWDNDKQISPWHDIPLQAADGSGHFNFLCEIPKL